MALFVIVGIFFSLAFLLLSIRIVYNLHLHPLARFPGPSLWCASRLPFLSKFLRGKLPNTIKMYHEKYGPVVRVAPDELSFDEPAAWHDIYLQTTLDRPPEWNVNPPGVNTGGFICAPTDAHSRLRRTLDPAFSETSVDGYEPIVTRAVDQMIAKLKSNAPRSYDKNITVELLGWLNHTFVDIISEICWGKSLGWLERTQDDRWFPSIMSSKESLVATAIAYCRPFNSVSTYLMSLFMRRDAILHDISREKTAARLLVSKKMDQDQKDIFSFILPEIDEQKLDVMEMTQAVQVIIKAGSETVSAGLAGTLHHLLCNRLKYDLLVREVRGTFKDEAEITGPTVRSLSYLQAVLTEGLRIAPPISDGLRRRVPAGGLVIAGCSVPGNTTVSAGCWVQSMNPRNFACPEEFVPERWLHEKGAAGKGKGERTIINTANREAFHPFGLGSRACLGQSLAWLEMRLTLAKLLWNFDIKLARGKKAPVWAEQDVFGYRDMPPMEVILRLRRKA